MVSRGCFVFASRNRRLGGGEPLPRVSAVAERLGLRTAAPAQDERPFRDLIRIPIPVDERHFVAVDEIRPILADLDGDHD